MDTFKYLSRKVKRNIVDIVHNNILTSKVIFLKIVARGVLHLLCVPCKTHALIMSDEDKALILNIIEDYKRFSLLWDKCHKSYKNQTERTLCLHTMATKYNLSTDEVKKKIRYLREHFHHEHKKVIKKRNSSGNCDIYPNWFAYKPLLFLADSLRPILDDSQGEMENFTASDSLLSENESEFTYSRLKRKRILSKLHNEKEETYTLGRNSAKESIPKGKQDKAYKFKSKIADESANNDKEHTFSRNNVDNPIHKDNSKTEVSRFDRKSPEEFTKIDIKEEEGFRFGTKSVEESSHIDIKEEEMYTFEEMGSGESVRKDESTICTQNDECSVYGQLVSLKLRKLNSIDRLLAQQRINNILFDLEMNQINRAVGTENDSENIIF